jgi:hypothetical protein
MQSVYRISYKDYKSIYHTYITNKLVFDTINNAGCDSLNDIDVPDEWGGLFDGESMSEIVEECEVPGPEYPFILLGEFTEYVY